jgi:hypothetical protein
VISYAVDIRAISDETLTAGKLQEIACEELKLCESIGCYRCGMGEREDITCNQLESDEVGYELQVSASEGPQTFTGAPGWLLVSWMSRGALHFELSLDEGADAELTNAFFNRLHTLGILSVSMTNRSATPSEHPASLMPQFRPAPGGEFD